MDSGNVGIDGCHFNSLIMGNCDSLCRIFNRHLCNHSNNGEHSQLFIGNAVFKY